jgi:PiT family inorganic phosphate transporter
VQSLAVLVAALLGALGWNLVMWKLALPTSSGHALLGGLVGAFVGAYGFDHIHWDVFVRMFLLLGLVPLAGALLGYGLSRFTYWIGEFMTPAWGGILRRLQIASLAGSALAHGSNDGQKTMVMIGLAMAAAGMNGMQRSLPWPVTFLCGLALMTGLVLGSKRIIQKLGQKLYRVQPLQGVCAQTATALLVGASSLVGYPMSSSQLISTSLLGAGVAVHPRGVRWELVTDIGLAWLITLPTAAVVSGVLGSCVRWLHVVP